VIPRPIPDADPVTSATLPWSCPDATGRRDYPSTASA
jgi:hypothetical protein